MNPETKQNLASQLETAATALREQVAIEQLEALDCNGPQFTKHFSWSILENGNNLSCYGTPKTDSGHKLLKIPDYEFVVRGCLERGIRSKFEDPHSFGVVLHDSFNVVLHVEKKSAAHVLQSLELDISNREELVASLDQKIANLEAEANVLTEIVSNI